MKSGRAVAQPIWKGAFFRDDSLFSFHWRTLPHESSAYRDITLQWHKDLSRTIDYLETRPDIDAEKIGYYGLSWGGRAATIALATQPRLKVAVLNVGGLHQTELLPEIDDVNFVPRVRQPVLMLSGEHDIVFPLETNQRPMFELLGTDPAYKRLHIVPTAHFVPQNELIRETLDWLDRYLEPVEP
jgi:dienelactone hydrolase